VSLELIVDPASSGDKPQYAVSCMLWSTGEDPRLVDAQIFLSPTDLSAWLKAKAVRHGPEIAIRWTPRLKRSSVARIVAACLDTQVPAD
jgi:hypothetical protein